MIHSLVQRQEKRSSHFDFASSTSSSIDDDEFPLHSNSNLSSQGSCSASVVRGT